MKLGPNVDSFLALVRAGLWADIESFALKNYGITKPVDWNNVYQLAEEQSVLGLILAGLEFSNLKPPQELLLQWIGEVQMLEQQNKAMNHFIALLVEKMRKAEDIYTLLVKGQGLAQCYERPLWRVCGDIDFLLSDKNYENAKRFLLPLSSDHNPEGKYSKHFVMNIEGWLVEIHGSLRTCLSSRIDKQIDSARDNVFYGGNVRLWHNNGTSIFLPSPDNDAFLVFTHFLKHFYKEKMNLRQLCDWCRLLWTYKDSLNREILELRIRKAGLMREWKAFAVLAVEWLDMPEEAMPFYDVRCKMSDGRCDKKAERILKHILKGEPYSKIRDTWAIAKIFPWNTMKFLPSIFFNVNGLKIKERLFN